MSKLGQAFRTAGLVFLSVGVVGMFAIMISWLAIGSPVGFMLVTAGTALIRWYDSV